MIGDVDGGEASFRAILEIRAEAVDVHFNLGCILDRKGDLRGAEDFYRRALELDPSDIDARNNLGVAEGDKEGLKASIGEPSK